MISRCLFSQDNFLIFHNGELYEKRTYAKGKLCNIVTYEQDLPQDSFIYENDNIQCFRYQTDSIAKNPLCPYAKYYYYEFDESLQDNYIYHVIKSHLLLERVLSFLAIIDSEVTGDNHFSKKRQLIPINKDCYCIQYKKINIKFQLFGEFEMYRYEPLKNMHININNGFLTKVFLKGRKTDIELIFEYEGNTLKKEKIFYYKSKSHRYFSAEEYSYKKIEALTKKLNKSISNSFKTKYVYDASGNKLRTIHEALVTNTTDYMGDFIFEDGKLSKYQFEGGYCSFDSNLSPTYHYYEKDHLGSIRMAVTGINQKNNLD